MPRCHETRLLRFIEGDAKALSSVYEKNRPLVIGALTPRMRAELCAARCNIAAHAHSYIRARARARPSRSGTAMRDLVPLRRRSTFELGLPRSQLSPLRRRMSVEGRRECTITRQTAGATSRAGASTARA